MKDSTIQLADGRTLAYTDIGDPNGWCLFFFHGAPASRLFLAPLEDEFEALGIRVVTPDRPGYGGSSRQPGRTLAHWPDDVVAIADALRVERFAVAGHSSGGPYAVACCALLPDRVTGGVVLGGVTDMAWPDAREGFPPVELDIMDRGDEEACTERCAELFAPDGSRFFDEHSTEWPEPDVAYFNDEANGAALEATLTEAFRQGVCGYAQDAHVQAQPWSFDPTGTSVPMAVVHGELDTVVPLAHSRHMAETIPTARFRMMPGHGHLTPVTELGTIATELIEAAG